jgi:ATP adenylyltransferase
MSRRYLWTPWRMQYISGAGGSQLDAMDGEGPSEATYKGKGKDPPTESTGCVFCDKVRVSPERDRDNLVLLRGERNFVILNLYPYNSAHLMVVPYEHTAHFTDLDTGATAEMMALLQRMVSIIGEEYKPEGYNLGMNIGKVAGAGVADHIHMHLVPRWAGDTNFMPIVGETKVMPELLETTYDRLKSHL